MSAERMLAWERRRLREEWHAQRQCPAELRVSGSAQQCRGQQPHGECGLRAEKKEPNTKQEPGCKRELPEADSAQASAAARPCKRRRKRQKREPKRRGSWAYRAFIGTGAIRNLDGTFAANQGEAYSAAKRMAGGQFAGMGDMMKIRHDVGHVGSKKQRQNQRRRMMWKKRHAAINLERRELKRAGRVAQTRLDKAARALVRKRVRETIGDHMVQIDLHNREARAQVLATPALK